METKIEVTVIKANSSPVAGNELFWLVSRSQLEFILQDITVFRSPPFVATAQYQEVMLPVINLEQHFGLEEVAQTRAYKYLVVRAVNPDRTITRMIIETPNPLKIQELATGFGMPTVLSLPRNGVDILGTYNMSDGRLGIVPDIARIASSLKWRGDRPQ